VIRKTSGEDALDEATTVESAKASRNNSPIAAASTKTEAFSSARDCLFEAAIPVMEESVAVDDPSSPETPTALPEMAPMTETDTFPDDASENPVTESSATELVPDSGLGNAVISMFHRCQEDR